MSRIGRAPITIPKGVDVELTENHIRVKGPKGELQRDLHHAMTVEITDGVLTVSRPTDQKEHRALHGLTRALVNNMVLGVTEGFRRELEIVGVGFRVEAKPKGVLLNVGHTHGVFVENIPGIKLEVPRPNVVSVTGLDKQLVGQVAAEIRAVRKPDSYKGKGIRYAGEKVKTKAGKTAK